MKYKIMAEGQQSPSSGLSPLGSSFFGLPLGTHVEGQVGVVPSALSVAKDFHVSLGDAKEQYNIGLKFLDEDMLEKAIEAFTESISIVPDGNLGAYSNRALAYMGLGDFEKARADYLYVVSQDPNCEVRYDDNFSPTQGLDRYPILDPYCNLGYIALEIDEDYQQALLLFSKGLELSPRHHILLHNRADTYIRLGHPLKALVDTLSCLKNRPRTMLLGPIALFIRAISQAPLNYLTDNILKRKTHPRMFKIICSIVGLSGVILLAQRDSNKTLLIRSLNGQPAVELNSPPGTDAKLFLPINSRGPQGYSLSIKEQEQEQNNNKAKFILVQAGRFSELSNSTPDKPANMFAYFINMATGEMVNDAGKVLLTIPIKELEEIENLVGRITPGNLEKTGR